MKRLAHILVGFFLCAVTSICLFSCQEEEPNFDIILNSPENPDILVYKGQPSEYEFTIDRYKGAGITAGSSASLGIKDLEIQINPDYSGGKVTFTLTEDSASFTVRLLGTEGKSASFSVSVSAYYARLSGGPEEVIDDGKGSEVEYVIESNLPENDRASLEVVSSCDWVSANKEGIKVLIKVSENKGHTARMGSFFLQDKGGLLKSMEVPVSQDWCSDTPDGGTYVQFKEKAFKAAMLDIADIDNDNQISLDEAALVKSIDISGKGISDLTGLECFVNLEYLNAVDNDIRHADMLKELHFLHWLDLKGNPNLESFDITGCSVYFERCWFDLNDKLHYRYFLRQTNITYDCDKLSSHAEVVFDERVTTDFSFQDEITCLKKHSKGDGRKAICLSGIGYLDIDHYDGSFERILLDALDAHLDCWPTIKSRRDEFDIYLMRHVSKNREEYVYPSADFYEDYAQKIRNEYRQLRSDMWNRSYDAICADKDVRLLNINVDVHPNVLIVPTAGFRAMVNDNKQFFSGIYPNPAMDIDLIGSTHWYNNSPVETIHINQHQYSSEPELIEFFRM